MGDSVIRNRATVPSGIGTGHSTGASGAAAAGTNPRGSRSSSSRNAAWSTWKARDFSGRTHRSESGTPAATASAPCHSGLVAELAAQARSNTAKMAAHLQAAMRLREAVLSHDFFNGGVSMERAKIPQGRKTSSDGMALPQRPDSGNSNPARSCMPTFSADPPRSNHRAIAPLAAGCDQQAWDR